MAFGYDGDGQIQKLKFNIKQGNAITNLSQILANPNFLISSWVKKCSNKGSITPAFDGSMDGIGANSMSTWKLQNNLTNDSYDAFG
jgi:hypothetical protein